MLEEIPKVFTEEILAELSKSKSAKELLNPIIIENFKFLGTLITEDDSKVTQILSSFFLDSFSFFKFQYSFTPQQLSILLDILLQLLLHSIKTSRFDKEQDIQFTQSLLLPHAQGMNSLYDSTTLKLILKHLNLTYFNHYALYQFLFQNEREQENQVALLDIDVPLPKDPHHTSTQRIFKPATAPAPIVESSKKEVEPVPVKESLKERLLKNMNENIREKFLEKIAEAREAMSKQLEQRDKMLKQKWEDLEKELKRKRRRP